MESGVEADDRTAIEHLVEDRLHQQLRSCEAIEGGLSLRRFYRLTLEGGRHERAVARIEGPEDPSGRPAGSAPEPPLEPVRALLEREGLPVPRRIAAGAGIELLEDLGLESLEMAARAGDGSALRDLYSRACALIPRLQRVESEPGVAAFDRRLDRPMLAYKAQRLIDWGVPFALGRSASPGEAELVRAAFEAIATACEGAPQRLAHRDFKAANLMLQRTPGAPPRLAMIDLQGAFLAPPEYDLVCLLRDSHVELPEALVQTLLEEIRSQLPDGPDPRSFATRFDLLTVSRVGKDMSLYLSAARERGERRYQRFVPSAARNLCAALGRLAPLHPVMASLRELLAPMEGRALRESGISRCGR